MRKVAICREYLPLIAEQYGVEKPIHDRSSYPCPAAESAEMRSFLVVSRIRQAQYKTKPGDGFPSPVWDCTAVERKLIVQRVDFDAVSLDHSLVREDDHAGCGRVRHSKNHDLAHSAPR